MLQNYFRIALRHLSRNGRYVTINVAGMGIALAFCIFAFENYQFAYSYDQWHPEAARIFRVEAYKNTNHLLHGVCPAMLPPQALSELAGVEDMTRIDSRGVVIKRGEEVYLHEVHFADENFLDFFQFELIAGQARLNDRDAVLINEDMAVKFFGADNPVGKTLLFYADTDQRKNLTISGVVKNCPKNSSIQFRFLTHLGNQLEGDQPVRYDSWRWMTDAGFIRLKNAADAPKVEAALQRFVAPQNAGNLNWQAEKYRLDPLLETAIAGHEIRWNNLNPSSPPAALWSNTILAALLLLSACLNFANTTLAIGNRRLREMGVRKVMGGNLRQLRMQLLGEAFIVCLLALLLGMLLAYQIVDTVNSLWTHLDLKLSYLNNPPMLLFLMGVVVVTTLLAGSYPAFYLSRFNPAAIFRNTFRFGGSSLFSRIMMGAQVSVAVMGMVVGLSFARNAKLQRDADIGYLKEGIVGVEAGDLAALKTFENALRQHPKVQAIATTRHHAGWGYRRAEFEFRGQTQETLWFEVGKDYLPTMGMKVLKGADFSSVNPELGSQTTVLVNETFVREIGGGEEMIGTDLRFDTVTYRIAGVVKDFMPDSPFEQMTPAVIRCAPEAKLTYCILKTHPEDAQQVYADMEATWKKLFPYKPFAGFYQDEVLKQALEISNNLSTTLSWFSIVTLLLTISGLFAIISLNALKQWRSLALRRVLGATPSNIALHLNRNFLLVMVVALLMGSLGGYAFTRALMDGIYKIHAGISGWVIVASMALVLGALAITLWLKLKEILRANLMEALKAE
ncbi:MAG: FtsX-like permease family protein [Saprospiraceae bacterium]|nr:FtsX-like permease family protein [Saprospiraceae bacterium]